MKSLQAKIAVMQAALEGKKIQLRRTYHSADMNSKAQWESCNVNALEWNWSVYDFRVEPKPLIVYAAVTGPVGIKTFTGAGAEESARRCCNQHGGYFVKCVEER